MKHPLIWAVMAVAAGRLFPGTAVAADLPYTPKSVAIVINSGDDGRPVFDALSKNLKSRSDLSEVRLETKSISDPIERGKILALLQSRDLIVSVGNDATTFVTGELEDTPIFFVGASTLEGSRIQSEQVAGVFSYNVESLLDGIHALRRGTIGLAYTPGYEPVASRIQSAAAGRQIELYTRKISGLREVSPAVRDIMGRCTVIWVLGDPLLTRNSGFEFLRERSLSQEIPIVVPGVWGVKHGALMTFEADTNALSVKAEQLIDLDLRGQLKSADRLQEAPPNGTLVLNSTLADKWKIVPPRGFQWRMIR